MLTSKLIISKRVLVAPLAFSTLIFALNAAQVSADAVLIVSDKKAKSGAPVSRPFEAGQGAEQNKKQSSAQWEMINQIEQLQMEVQELRGTVEELSYMLEQFKKSSRDRYIDLDRRISKLSNTQRTQSTDKAPQALPSKAGIPGNANPQEKALYKQAKKNIDSKRFRQAAGQLDELIQNYPDGAYVSNAHYWLGELNLAFPEPNYQEAEIHFLKLLQRDSSHQKVPAALFKLGKLYDLTGQKQLAIKYLERVVKQYPDDSSAGLARRYLKEMEQR